MSASKIDAATETVVGRWIVVRHADAFRTGTVMDYMADEPMKPKRVRIQHGPMQGMVLMPTDYSIKCWLDEDTWA